MNKQEKEEEDRRKEKEGEGEKLKGVHHISDSSRTVLTSSSILRYGHLCAVRYPSGWDVGCVSILLLLSILAGQSIS